MKLLFHKKVKFHLSLYLKLIDQIYINSKQDGRRLLAWLKAYARPPQRRHRVHMSRRIDRASSVFLG